MATTQQPIRDVEWTRARDIRRELASETKDRLIVAAKTVFAQKGYDAATIGDISSAAGVSRPTYYVYFASKAEVFQVIAEQIKDDVLEAHHHQGPMADDPVLVSQASLAGFIRLYSENLEILEEIDKRAGGDPEIAALLDIIRGKPLRRTLRHIESLRRAGLANPLVDEDYAAKVMGAVSMDAAADVRADPSRFDYCVDQTTRTYLAVIGFVGDLSALDAASTE